MLGAKPTIYTIAVPSGSSVRITASGTYTAYLLSVSRDGTSYNALGYLTYVYNSNLNIDWLISNSNYAETDESQYIKTIGNNSAQTVYFAFLNIGYATRTLTIEVV